MSILRTRSRFAAALLLVIVAGCGGGNSTPTASTTTSVDGTWAGSVQDSLAGAGTVRVTLASSGSLVTGTWGATFPDPAYNTSGTVNGTSTATSLSLTVTPSVAGACPFTFTATRSSNQLSGTYATFDCNVSVSGSATVTRQ